ncbi:ribonuclease H-like domain-containing protein [Montanilutibacter psychrotolerans]|uniref:Exonuclease n=1 Tax=Montanilutibacter psychrotolerans TaxID=1327343 RepID=A0A3M8SYM3_9GAMM|nr:ribonuclease H-like domain-containing protein [Lysobacter psychrotolerans]RNF83652.1 exonuclease [Lysobacter psychrotolerans]
MSVTIERLRALKRQAGGTAPAAHDRSDGAAEARPPGVAPSRSSSPASRAALPTRFLARADDAQASLPASTLSHGAAFTAHVLPGAGAAPGNDASTARGGSAPDPMAALRRLLETRGRRPTPPPVTRGPIDRHLPGEEIAPGLRLIETRQPFDVPPALSLAFARREGQINPRDVLFFDTETTGLAGGTGTRAFMIGAADWHHDPDRGDTLRVRQLLITTMAAEPAMLAAFAQWLRPDTVLCSYNGRSYDAPLLKTRYRLARQGDPIGLLDHLDLLHPTRRRYRGRWENCRLATIERELLRIVREDDLPGSQAPAAWLQYLRGGAATNLGRVAAHNHQDVVTLARLLLRLVVAQADADAAT